MREEVEVLEDQADPRSYAVNECVLLGGRQPYRRGPADVHIPDSNVSLVEAFEPVQAPQHRRLAAARRPENRGELALGDTERGAIQHWRRAIAFDDVGDVDHEGSSTGSTRIALRGDHIRSWGCQRLSKPRIELSRPAGRRCPRRSRQFESSSIAFDTVHRRRTAFPNGLFLRLALGRPGRARRFDASCSPTSSQ